MHKLQQTTLYKKHSSFNKSMKITIKEHKLPYLTISSVYGKFTSWATLAPLTMFCMSVIPC